MSGISRLASLGCLCLNLAMLGLATRADPRQPLTLDRLLQAAGAYVQGYQRAMSAVVAREVYEQTVVRGLVVRETGPLYRKTTADLLLFEVADAGWVSFRDVYQADGQAVRDHDQRLASLFAQFMPNSLPQARRIAAESARFNLNPTGIVFTRTANTPLSALLFLRAINQPRSTFRLGKTTETINGVTTAMVTFTEQAKPRLIGSRDGAAAIGTFWIEPDSGRVVRSLFRLDTAIDRVRYVTSELSVTFGPAARLDVWPPLEMKEQYGWMPTEQRLIGRAAYSNFRQFSVAVGEQVR